MGELNVPLRRMTARERTEAANWQLAALLAFNAGAVDVMGYLGLRQFTSHMSGIVATLAVEVGTKGYALCSGLRPCSHASLLARRSAPCW